MTRKFQASASHASEVLPNFRRQVARQFLKLYLPFVLVLSAAMWLVLAGHGQLEEQRLQTQENAHLEVAAHQLGRDFNMVSSDLMLLAESPALSRYLTHPGEQSLAQVAALFRVFAQEKGIYDQIRYLDRNGKEVVRVNYRNGSALVVPAQELQDKGGRYYFSDTMHLGNGRIFVSPLDLNIEMGRLEHPYKPMIRFATPVFDSAGKRRGIVILNYLAARLIAGFRQILTSSRGQPMLLDRSGYWLIASDPADEWGQMLDSRRRFPRRYPRIWETIRETDAGYAESNDGLFVFRAVRPLSDIHASSNGARQAVAPSSTQLAPDDYVWHLVTRVAADDLPGRRLLQEPVYLASVAGLLLLFTAVTWQLARGQVGRRMWQRALKESEGRFRAVFRDAGLGIALVDFGGRIQESNGALQALLGYPAEALAGREIVALLEPDGVPGFMSRFSDLAAGLREGYSGDLRWQRNGGETVVSRCHVTGIRASGPDTGLALVLVEDVGERLQVEERAQALQDQLAHLGRVSVMGEMAVVMAHELSTPLSAIVNFAAGCSLRIHAGRVTPEELLEPLDRISQQAKQAGEVIQRVRGFVGKDHSTSGITDLAQAVDETTALLERALKRHGVEVSTRIEPHLGPGAVPKVALQQVLLNLMLNAAEAMEENPEGAQRSIIVSAERAVQGMLKLTVSDTGPGVDAAALERLFEPFHTTKPNGLGMGLSICRTLVESWGGRIEVKAGETSGLSFHVTLPRHMEDQSDGD